MNKYKTLGMKSWLSAIVIVLLTMVTATMSAQQTTGAVGGIVTDASGAAIPNATVTANNTQTGFTRTTVSDSAGNYTIQFLPVDIYTVSVEAVGFKKFRQENLTVLVDQTQSLPVSLGIGATTETVTVTTAPPLVNVTSETLARTISPDEINNLPLVNRNAYSELSLTAGVQSNSASSSGASSPNFVIGVPSTQVIINGGVDGGVPMVAFYLDGGFNMTGLRNYGNQLTNFTLK